MSKTIKYFITALKLFFIQTVLEVALIITLLYIGIPYFEMNVGNEHFYEIVIGIFGFYALTKCIYYSLIYLAIFTLLARILKLKHLISYSILNGLLSIFYILLFLINGREINWILNPLIASIIASLSILIYSKIKALLTAQELRRKALLISKKRTQ